MTLKVDAFQIIARVRVGVVPDDNDQFYGFCPDLGCIHVAADTEEEAIRRAVEAVAVYLEMSIRHGDPIPIGSLQSDTTANLSAEQVTALGGGYRQPPKSFVENVPVALAART